MNLLLLRKDEVDCHGRASLRGRRAEHIRCVLRAKEGASIKVGLLGGRIGSARLLKVSRDEAGLEIGELTEEPPPPSPLALIVALPRPQSFKKVLHFVASAGIKRVYFIGSARVEKSYWSSSALKDDAVEEEVALGLEQGFDTIPPAIEYRRRLKPFVEDELPGLSKGSLCLLAHPYARRECPRDAGRSVFLAIGPEGGFVDNEIDLFGKAGFEPVSIGPRILRVEFAIASLSGRLF